MEVKLKMFGVVREIMGQHEQLWSTQKRSVGEIKEEIFEQYPYLRQLNSLFIAVNHQYAPDEQMIEETDEVALIPPVSGG
jgi:molybdopterin converting factor subunit 1